MEKRVDKQYPPVREMSDDQRVGLVKEIFSTVTNRYDFLNHFLSLRRDVSWRRLTVKKMSFPRTQRLLDVATGTADLAIDAARRHPAVTVTGLDFVRDMLAVGQVKVGHAGLAPRISFIQGDALGLPFGDNTFDVASMAFGIRNIPDKARALREMTRVVVPGGMVMILEMGFTPNWFSTLMYRFYLNRVLPFIGRVLSLNPSAYSYLADSIMNFPAPEAFLALMGEAGLGDLERTKMTFGATYLYTGIKGGRA